MIHKMIYKKSQIKSMETIAVLIVFFFLLAFGFSLYGRFRVIELEEKMGYLDELEIIKLSNTVYFLPELECPPSLEKDSCFDSYKISSLIKIIEDNKNFYTTKFGYSRIEIQEIFPSGESRVVYENKGNKESEMKIFSPVSLYDPITKKSKFGVLVVTRYY